MWTVRNGRCSWLTQVAVPLSGSQEGVGSIHGGRANLRGSGVCEALPGERLRLGAEPGGRAGGAAAGGQGPCQPPVPPAAPHAPPGRRREFVQLVGNRGHLAEHCSKTKKKIQCTTNGSTPLALYKEKLKNLH